MLEWLEFEIDIRKSISYLYRALIEILDAKKMMDSMIHLTQMNECGGELFRELNKIDDDQDYNMLIIKYSNMGAHYE